MTKREAVIVSAYTGNLIGEYDDFHKYAEEKLERPVSDLEMHKHSIIGEIKDKSYNDFISIEVACK